MTTLFQMPNFTKEDWMPESFVGSPEFDEAYEEYVVIREQQYYADYEVTRG
jgi:hypothetical protein